ncbi:MAG: hypothetical protein ABR540_09485 [Acidimicrobiales bacterium]
MHDALRRSDRVMPLLSHAYLSSGFAAAKWAEAFASDPTVAPGPAPSGPGRSGVVVPEVLATVPRSLALLAERLRLPTDDAAAVVDLLHGEQRHRDRWLVIFDNAEDPNPLAPSCPRVGAGRVTSRIPAWRARAATLDVDVLSEAEAVAFRSPARAATASGPPRPWPGAGLAAPCPRVDASAWAGGHRNDQYQPRITFGRHNGD